MVEKYFKIYVPAAQQAVNEAKHSAQFEVKGPSYFVSQDEATYLDEHEDEAYAHEPRIFDVVTLYIDAQDHRFDEIDGIPVDDYKRQVLQMLKDLQSRYSAH